MHFLERLNKQIEIQTSLVYVDAGAMGGIPQYWRGLGKNCRAIAFEPDEREFEKLKSSAEIVYLPYALAETSRDLTFHIAQDGGKSSLYKPNMGFLSNFPHAGRYTTVREVHVPKEKVKTLDQALALHQIKDVDFIKLDTQGSELDILKGAQAVLPGVFGCEIEVEFCKLYEGQPLFADIDVLMQSHGFELVDLRRVFWKRVAWGQYIGRGQLTFADALYFRRAEAFLDVLVGFSPQNRLEKIARAVASCMVYRLADYAVDLLVKTSALKYIDEAQYQVMVDCVRAEASGWGMPGLLGRGVWAKVFNRLSESVRPKSYLGFADSDRFIGNIRNI